MSEESFSFSFCFLSVPPFKAFFLLSFDFPFFASASGWYAGARSSSIIFKLSAASTLIGSSMVVVVVVVFTMAGGLTASDLIDLFSLGSVDEADSLVVSFSFALDKLSPTSGNSEPIKSSFVVVTRELPFIEGPRCEAAAVSSCERITGPGSLFTVEDARAVIGSASIVVGLVKAIESIFRDELEEEGTAVGAVSATAKHVINSRTTIC